MNVTADKQTLWGNRRGYGFAALGVLGATALALLLERWLHSSNLVLVYVLAVVATGLRYGSRPAIAASVLSFLCFNFFLTEPRYTLEVRRQDELATLIFLFLIALICGPAASRIRQQLLLLREANRYSQTMRELEAVRAKAEVEQLRSALLSSVSHDLKSPLAAMMGAAESLSLLDKQLQPQDRRELVDTILQESRRLDSYIQNLLDMTRLGYGSLKIERDWVSVADIIGSALARLKRYHPEVHTDVQLPQAVPVIYVHAALIEQALFNILENAARFSPGDEVIQVSVAAADAHCSIAIEDRGPGIPAAVREKIFDMFYVVADGDQKQQGTGMGLAICRGMIGAHGGTVRAVEGRGGRGACVIVELPLDYPQEPPQEPHQDNPRE